MKLFDHQQNFIDLSPLRHLLSWETGTGKTLAMLELLEKYKIITLIVVPKSLKTQWQRQIDNGSIPHVLMTKEEFKKKSPSLIGFKAIILDEAHAWGNPKSDLTKKTLAYLKKYNPPVRLLATATPYLSTPLNVYSLGKLLGNEWDYWKFFQKYFLQVRMGPKLISQPNKRMMPELLDVLKKLGSQVKLADCIDMPDIVNEVCYVSLTKEQQSAIKAISLLESVPISRWTKIHQICGGSLKGDGYTDDSIYPCEKVDRIKSIVEEHPRIIISCRYKNEVALLEEVLKNKNVFCITGDTKNKQEVLDSLSKKDHYILLVTAACSEGWELKNCDVMVFYSLDFSLRSWVQMHGRITRIDAMKNKKLYITLVAEGTIDEDVKGSIDNKCDFQISLYDRS